MSTPTLTPAPAGAGAAGAAAGEDGAKKSTKKLMLVLPLVLALVGGAVWFFLLRGSGSEEAAHEEPKPGAVVALESINVNLADGHYLKLKLALQASADAHETPDGSKAQGIAGDHLTGKDMAELQTAKGRKHAQEELTEAIVKAYVSEGHETVIDVYYPEFVSQ